MRIFKEGQVLQAVPKLPHLVFILVENALASWGVDLHIGMKVIEPAMLGRKPEPHVVGVAVVMLQPPPDLSPP